jgi:predicted small secreted protein
MVLNCATKRPMNSTSSLLKASAIAAGLFALFSLGSCNTMTGVGRDLENAGSSIENAASQ